MTSGEHNILQEEDNYDDLIALMKDDQNAIDPGAAFFDSLHADIMGEVAHTEARQLKGHFEEPAPKTVKGPSSWLDGLRALFTTRPTLIMGVAMAAALIAIVVWPKSETGNSPFVVDAGQGIAQTDKTPGEKTYDPADGLDPEARAEALELANAIDLEMDLESEEDDWEELSEFDDEDEDLQTL